MSTQKREKANEVNRKYEPAFGKRVSFKAAFPSIEKIQVEVFEFDGFMRPKDDSYKNKNTSSLPFNNPRFCLYTETDFPGEFVDCSGPLCYNGGFNIVKIIRNMISKNIDAKEGDESCQGYLGSPKGRKKYKHCSHEFEYRIKIKYTNSH